MQGLLLSSVAKLKEKNSIISPAASKGLFTPEECDEIIRLGLAIPEEQAVAGFPDARPTDRNSKLHWMYPDPKYKWIYDRMDAAVQGSNIGYEFDLVGFMSGIQFTKYNVGDFYDWHLDIGGGGYSTRKLSLTVQLTDPSEYEGGNLEFMFAPEFQSRERGSITVFPSFLPHRVTPVTRGQRMCLVTWVDGHAFR